MSNEKISNTDILVAANRGNIEAYPLLALRDVVVYPYMQIALFVGREKSINAVNVALKNDDLVFVVAQQDSLAEDINQENLYHYGTVCRIVQVIEHENEENCIKVLIEGVERANITALRDEGDYLMANTVLETTQVSLNSAEQQEQRTALLEVFTKYAAAKLRNARELTAAANKIERLLELVYFIATRAPMAIDVKQQFLESADIKSHVAQLSTYLARQIEEQALDQSIHESTKKAMEKNQREYFLNEKIKVIQNELSEMNADSDDENSELQKRLAAADLPDDVRKKAESEFKKLKSTSPASGETTVIRNYLEWLLNTPWKKSSKISINLKKAEDILNADHYGLEEVKERVLEYLAVQSRVKAIKGPIICLVGPPGVGKTSLGESLAKATGREFVRMALGGVRDEAEIRGHRRTYIGALPGKIVQNLSKVGVKNPLFLLDEIDKMAQDSRGDPASALLEVLDPSQNHKFNDHYLDFDLDLSEVMFICTANSMNIPEALLDRMEVIRLPGYTEEEKVNIAERYLIPRAKQNNGLKEDELVIEESAVRDLIRRYTREAGVRSLEREIAKICRKVVKTAVTDADTNTVDTSNNQSNTTSAVSDEPVAKATPKAKKSAKNKMVEQIKVSLDNLADYSGVYKFDFGRAAEDAQIGRVTGLAWTSVGGVLLNIEAAAVKGKGVQTSTGSLGNVMQESIKAAMTVVRSRGDKLGIAPEQFEKLDVHLHVPEGATPKDGPSAGIAMTTALVSAMTNIPIRADVAMTGEITLHGDVLPIGGLKEKLLAAHRGGIKLALIPKENMRELHEIPDNIKAGIEIKGVTKIDEVLEIALTRMPDPLPAAPIMPVPVVGTVQNNTIN